MIKVIDTHAYIGVQSKIELDARVEHYRMLKEILLKRRIDISFIVMSASLLGNHDVVRIVDSNSDIFLGGVLQVAPNRLLIEQNGGVTTPKEIEGILSSNKIKGLKLVTSLTRTAVNDPTIDDYASLAVQYDVPFIFHCSASGQDFAKPEYFSELLDKHPGLRIVCAHYGGLNPEFIPAYIKLARNNEELYLNTAGLGGEVKRYLSIDPLRILREDNPNRWTNTFLETIDGIQDKVVFGSDYPELQFRMHPINLAESAIQEKVFYRNAERIFRL